MNKEESKSILHEKLTEFASKSYLELVSLVDKHQCLEVCGNSGVKYQIEFNVFFDSGKKDILRIVGSIDDGGGRAFMPLTETLLMKPDGTFI